MTAYQMFGLGLAIFAGIGFAVGWPVWRATQERFVAVTAGSLAGLLGVAVAFWLYFTRVLCSPGAGCA